MMLVLFHTFTIAEAERISRLLNFMDQMVNVVTKLINIKKAVKAIIIFIISKRKDVTNSGKVPFFEANTFKHTHAHIQQ